MFLLLQIQGCARFEHKWNNEHRIHERKIMFAWSNFADIKESANILINDLKKIVWMKWWKWFCFWFVRVYLLFTVLFFKVIFTKRTHKKRRKWRTKQRNRQWSHHLLLYGCNKIEGHISSHFFICLLFVLSVHMLNMSLCVVQAKKSGKVVRLPN